MELSNVDSKDLLNEIFGRIATGEVSFAKLIDNFKAIAIYQESQLIKSRDRQSNFEFALFAAWKGKKNQKYGDLNRDEFIQSKIDLCGGKTSLEWTTPDTGRSDE